MSDTVLSDTVLIEKRESVALLTLNRPEAMNALSRELRESLSQALRELQADEQIRVAILTGNGKAFCAGFDLKELSQDSGMSLDKVAENDLAMAMKEFEGPIIAAVNGHAITGGFELALACDMIVASSTASFADTHARVGILPGWGLSQRLPRLIGIARAKELSFTGNKIGAQQAYEWGLVNRVVEPQDLIPLAWSLAQDMASCVAPVLTQYKALIDSGFTMDLESALKYEAEIGIKSAQAASAAMVAERKAGVLDRGRKQKSE